MDYLPIFLDLRDRPVLVVGGGAVAARKVELLLAAQARVRVVAPALSAPLAAHAAAGRIEAIAQPFEPRHFDSVLLAIAATDQIEVNRAVAAAGAQRGVFVNVVDDAQASSCIMPAIVDRSPVLIAIGTAGQSPTLAQRLRAQLESLLPQRLGEVARFAGRARARVRAALPEPNRRRQFWQRWLDSGVPALIEAGQSQQAEAESERQLQQARERAPASGAIVYLIGAGPGDPDLLTLRAQQLLQQCDVVLYDRLVSTAVLERVRRDAERVFVGKQSGQHRITQQRIHDLLLDYAAKGLRIARLKGGDPLVFGRAGEEIELLRRAGIPFVVVPGITAASGAAAVAGISLTQRGLSQSVTFVTAMGEAAEALDWQALAAPLQTIVFYMGVAQLPRIVQHLRAHGAPSERAVLIVERATLAQQRSVAGNLGDIEQRATRMQVAAPALLIVGDVAAVAAERDGMVQLSGYTGSLNA